MLAAAHAIAVLVLAGTLLASGALKARDPAGTRGGIAGFRAIPPAIVPVVAAALPVVEIALAVGLLLTSGVPFALVAAAAVGLMLGFTAVVALALGQDEAPSCPCFGATSATPVSAVTVLRNAALTGLALVALLAVRPFAGLPRALLDHAPVWVALVLVSAASIGLCSALWASRRALRRDRDLLRAQVDDLLSRPSVAAAPEIPGARLLDHRGDDLRLADLVERSGRAQLLVVVSPTCGACHDLVPMIATWRTELRGEIGVALLSWADLAPSLDAYGDHAEHLYITPDGTAARDLGVGGTPSAVLLGLDGTVAAGPAAGLEDIIGLLTAVIQALGVNTMTGRLHAPEPPRPLGGEDSGADHLPATGTPITDVRVRDEHGDEAGLLETLDRLAPGRDLPVVAWRDTCPYCTEIAPALAPYSTRGEVVLLVNEDVATVRAQGLSGPVLQTIGADAATALGVPGTPGGFPVAAGTVAAGGGVGGASVLRMLADRAERG